MIATSSESIPLTGAPRVRPAGLPARRDRLVRPVPRSSRDVLHAVCLVLIVWLATTAARADELSIVAAGRSPYRIVCPSDALPATRLAATELQGLLARSTGARLPIVMPAQGGAASIIFRLDTSLPRDAFALRVEGSNLVIVGHDTAGDPRWIDWEKPVSCGTLYGVYELLETFLDVRFYWPDELGTIIPKRDGLAVPRDLDVTQRPHFGHRRLRYGPQYINHRDEAATRMWGRRLRLGASTPTRFYHAWYRILDVPEWARKGHPEYAALVNGARRTEYDVKRGKPSRRNGQVCTSNPEVKAIFIAAARMSRDAMVSVSPNDGHSAFCECGPCRALDSGRLIPDGKRAGRPCLSDRIVGFYNLIAERAGRPVGGYAYNEYVEVPRDTPLHPNVTISMTLNDAWLSGDAKELARAERLCRAWGAYSPRTSLYDILFLESVMHDLIVPLGEDVERRVRLVADSGLAGAQLYIAPNMQLGGPDAYIAGKMLWNPALDARKERERYFRDLYGPAWRSVQRLYDLAAKQWRKAVATKRRAVDRRRVQLEVVSALRLQLAGAEREAGSAPIVMRRLLRLREALEGMRE